MKKLILLCAATLMAALMWTPGNAQSYCTGDAIGGELGSIDGFTTSNAIQNINNLENGYANGYSDYTAIVVSQIAGQTIDFSAFYAGSLGPGVAVFIDYNQDYTFQASEKVFTTGSYPNDSPVTGTITIPSGTANGNYRLRVVGHLSDSDPGPCHGGLNGEIEDYTLTVTDPATCVAPTALAVDAVSKTSADISWTANNSEGDWVVKYTDAPNNFDPETDGTPINVSADPNTSLTGLTADTNYDVYVKAICSEDNTSDWTGPESFTTEMEPCEGPTDIAVSDIDDSSATVTWTPGGDETEWEVIYGEAGFDLDTDGDVIPVSDTPGAVLDNLEEDLTYDVYVRAICGDDNNSDWTGPISFNTELGVDSQVFENFTYYPNPVKSQLTLKAGAQIESVTVYNLLGQEVINVKPNTLETQINVENLQAAVYMMKVNINGNTKIFRIVKR